jgi:hypothetical protein
LQDGQSPEEFYRPLRRRQKILCALLAVWFLVLLISP